jgi:hypothetical protein
MIPSFTDGLQGFTETDAQVYEPKAPTQMEEPLLQTEMRHQDRRGKGKESEQHDGKDKAGHDLELTIRGKWL